MNTAPTPPPAEQYLRYNPATEQWEPYTPPQTNTSFTLPHNLTQTITYTCRVINLSAGIAYYTLVYFLYCQDVEKGGQMGILILAGILHLIFHYYHLLKPSNLLK